MPWRSLRESIGAKPVSVPLPPTTQDTLTHLREQLDAVRKFKPRNAAQARARAAEIIRRENILSEASRQMMDATAQKQIADHSNGYANGHASGAATYLTDEDFPALAKSIAGFVDEKLAPLIADIAELKKGRGELEDCVRNLVQAAARRDD